MEEESNEYEYEMKQNENERNDLIEQMKLINEEYSLAKETIEQRNEILQEKVRRISLEIKIGVFE